MNAQILESTGGRDVIVDNVDIPPDAVKDAIAYLHKRPFIAAGPLLRIFVANWKAGHNLNL